MTIRAFAACLLTAALSLAAGCGTPSLLITPVSNTSELQEVSVTPGSGFSPPKVAMVEVEGMLINARTGGFLQPQENKLSLFAEEMDRAASDSSVKAVVLRINSPGGTVVCSDTMYQIVQKFKAQTHKPVVADTQEVTASGAYYVACACDKIVAHPTSIVGSIGVIFETFEFSGLMDKLGIVNNSITSGPNKAMGSPFKPMTDSERAIMQKMVNEFYARFKGVVLSNRHIAESDVAMVTDGRVFSGEDAQRLGLVDQTGLLDDAINLAKDMAHAPGARVVMYKRPYGYTGSIYASSPTPNGQDADRILRLSVPGAEDRLPGGFYYLWSPSAP